MDHLVLDACEASFAKEGIPTRFIIPTTCEMVDAKVKWIQALRQQVPQVAGKTHCNFTALQDSARSPNQFELQVNRCVNVLFCNAWLGCLKYQNVAAWVLDS